MPKSEDLSKYIHTFIHTRIHTWNAPPAYLTHADVPFTPAAAHSPPLHACVSVSCPPQPFPPLAGAGLVHARDLDLVQSAVHCVHTPQSVHSPSITHWPPVHATDSEESPMQSLPPFLGAVHDLERVLIQSAAHSVQTPQSVHLPSTTHLPPLHARLSVALPTQSLPPFLGAVHDLERVLVQSAAHSVQIPQSVHLPSTTHLPPLHARLSVALPTQSLPPFWGAVHDLERVLVQSAAHSVQIPQSVHLPSTTHLPPLHARLSVALPTQSLPPFWRAVHDLERVLVQSAAHSVQIPQSVHLPSTTHLPPLHARLSVALPTQSLPPFWGAVHDLERVLVQSAAHSDQTPQSDHLPWTTHLPPEHVDVCLAVPVQSFPPLLGAGAVHDLDLSLVQSARHSDHSPHSVHSPSSGHFPPVHVTVSLALPLHAFPPFIGAGLLQERPLCFVQSASHCDHVPHSPQPPSTRHFPPVQSATCLLFPLHFLPPFCGIGLLHLRARSLVHPVPHSDHFPQSVQPPSTGFGGHLPPEHERLVVTSPGHDFPPYLGTGFVHERVRSWVQSAVHPVQLPQSVHPPLMAEKYRWAYIVYI